MKKPSAQLRQNIFPLKVKAIILKSSWWWPCWVSNGSLRCLSCEKSSWKFKGFLTRGKSKTLECQSETRSNVITVTASLCYSANMVTWNLDLTHNRKSATSYLWPGGELVFKQCPFTLIPRSRPTKITRSVQKVVSFGLLYFTPTHSSPSSSNSNETNAPPDRQQGLWLRCPFRQSFQKVCCFVEFKRVLSSAHLAGLL